MIVCQHVIACGLGNGGKHTELAAEALIVLDLVDIVVQNMKESAEGKFSISVDCRKVW